MTHSQSQRTAFDSKYANGPRKHVISADPLVQYITQWRLKDAMGRLARSAGNRLSASSSILCLCSGEGFEGSILADLGWTNVTVSDVSPVAVEMARSRDSRLNTVVLDLDAPCPASTQADVVIVQDGLHHLSRPAFGFTQMLDMARVGVIFLEPHKSVVGSLLGTRWERNGSAENFVFRWSRSLVDDLASSRLGRDAFENLSYSFWHHNPLLEKIGRAFHAPLGLIAVKTMKRLLDFSIGFAGNQFCGLLVKRAQ